MYVPSCLSLVDPSTKSTHPYNFRKRTLKAISDIHPIYQCQLDPVEQDPFDNILFKCNFKPHTKVNECTFFIRSYKEWNKIPLLIRHESDPELFQENIKNCIWDLLKKKIGISEWPD